MNIPCYFYRDAENREIGPLPLPALAQLRQAGVLNDDTLVRAETGAEWVECRTIIAAGAASSANAFVPPESGSPSASTTLGSGRSLGRYSWAVYVLALLCFLLPFVEVSCQQRPIASLNGYQFAFGGVVTQTNPISGVAESRSIPAETTATVALALACLGLLTALIKKPESNAIGVAAGVGGGIALLMLKAKIESQIAQQQGQGIVEIAFKGGYWLTLALLFCGTALQARAFAKAWSDGWRINRKHGIIIGCCLAVAAIFYAAPIGYRILANRAPSKVDLGNGVSVTLTWIPPTSNTGFTMGSPVTEQGRSNDENQHTVILTKGFWLGKTVVTQAQWEAVMESNPSNFKGSDLPVEQVSWDDAMAFSRKLTERERQAGRLPDGYEYTLPSEAQWEYACRAGTTGAYAGDLDAMAWFKQNSGNTTHPVGQKGANAWGLYDMHGNVWEWCRDWYGNYPGGSVTDPTGPPQGSDRVSRGGCWGNDAAICRSAFRYRINPGFRLLNLGFRLALAPQVSR